jgi:PAS domain S-box-containing protein
MVVKTEKWLIEKIEMLRGSEEKYKTLVEASQDAIVEANEEGRIILWNKGAERIFGYSAKEILGQPVAKLMAEKHRERHRKGFESFFLNGNRSVKRFVEGEGLRKDGSSFPIEWSLSGWKENGKTMVAAIGKDVSERKKAEEALRESEERYSRLCNSMNEAVALFSLPDLRISYWNKRFEEYARLMYAKDIEDITISDMSSTVEADDWDTAMKELAKALAGEPPSEVYELRIKDLEGNRRVLEARPSFYKERDQVVGVQVLLADITERKQAEKKLRESEERYSQLYRGINEAVVVFGLPDLKTSYWNRRFEEYAKLMFAKDIEDITVSDIAPTVEVNDWDMAMKALDKTLAGKPVPDVYELSVKDLKGNRRVIEVKPSFFKEKGQVVGIEVMISDITEHKRMEEALRRSEEKYKALFHSAVVGTFVIDAETMKVVLGNQAAAKAFGFNSVEEALKVNLLDFILPDDRERIIKIIVKDMFEEDLRQTNEFRAVTKDGREIWISAVGARIRHQGRLAGLVSFIDITERKNAEKRLRSSFINLAETVSRAIESRDPYTAGHQRGVAKLAYLVGERMGLDEDRLQGLYIGGLLHDIGKISIPASILTKLGKLTEEEWALICAHPKQGYTILKDTSLPWPVADMALHHHERLDGSGYPHGISGDKLSLEVRILAVCDVVEAMSSHRPYRPAKTRKEFLEEIKSGQGTKYDASVVDVVLQIIESGEFKFGWNGKNSRSTATKVPVP